MESYWKGFATNGATPSVFGCVLFTPFIIYLFLCKVREVIFGIFFSIDATVFTSQDMQCLSCVIVLLLLNKRTSKHFKVNERTYFEG